MRLITLLILLTIGGVAYSQAPVVVLDLVVKDDVSREKLEAVSFDVYKNNELLLTETSVSNGKVPPIELALNAEYRLVIRKDGYVSKLADIDTRFDSPENLPSKVEFLCETSLFRVCEANNFDFLKEEPVIKMSIDESGYQTWDKEYTKGMLLKIQEGYYANLSKTEHETFSKNYHGGMEMMEFYKFDEGLILLNKAKEIVDCQYVIDKIKECELQLAIQNEYDKYIAAGDQFMKNKDYKNANVEFQKAGELRPQERYPLSQMEEIQYLKVVDTARERYKNKEYASALKLFERAVRLKPDGEKFKTEIEKCQIKSEKQ